MNSLLQAGEQTVSSAMLHAAWPPLGSNEVGTCKTMTEPESHSPCEPDSDRSAIGVDLSKYDQRGYTPGAGALKRAAWYIVNALFFDSWLFPWSAPKRALLRLFGATVGTGVVIKPRVNIKYPWHLQIGSNTWMGEGAWIDNLASVVIGSNACISQGAYLLTGNHDYRDPRFGLLTGEILIADGAWVGARAIVGPGVRMGRESVLTAGSLLTVDADPHIVYRGNPATPVRSRIGT